MRPFLHAVMAFALAMSLSPRSSAESGRIERAEVEAVVSKAQSLAAAGDLAAASALLDESLRRCPRGPAGLECRPLLNYTQGYLHQQAARRMPEARDRLLGRAEAWYRRVLSDVQDHAKTQENLANVFWGLGKPREAVAWLERAARSDPSGKARYFAAIGHFYREQALWDRAISAFEQAGEIAPDDETPRLGLVETYAQRHEAVPGAEDAMGRLRERLPVWQNRFPNAAEAGRWLSLKVARDRGEAGAADAALVDLIASLAVQDRLTPDRMTRLRREFPGEAVDQLSAYLETPDSNVQWWRESSARRHAISLAALSLGRLELADQGPEAAVRRWRSALENLAPKARHYAGGRLKGKIHARLELQTELAALYHRYPGVEPRGAFRDLIWSIFGGKSASYAAGDQETIQRHHMVLGKIYAEAPERESAEFYAMNAAFQLHNAIETANRRAARGETYQPLAHIKHRLAEVCSAPSDTVARTASRFCSGENAPDQRYLQAARAYLDSDQLDRADEMLGQVGAISAESPAYRELQAVLAVRRDSGALATPRADSWLSTGRLDSLPSDFVRRQRFKVLADATAAAQNPAELVPLLDEAAEGVVLAGAADNLRAKKIADYGVATVKRAPCPLEDIRFIQRGINRLAGTALQVDGAFGSRTSAALKALQRREGVAPSGRVDRATKERLRELLCDR